MLISDQSPLTHKPGKGAHAPIPSWNTSFGVPRPLWLLGIWEPTLACFGAVTHFSYPAYGDLSQLQERILSNSTAKVCRRSVCSTTNHPGLLCWRWGTLSECLAASYRLMSPFLCSIQFPAPRAAGFAQFIHKRHKHRLYRQRSSVHGDSSHPHPSV